MEENNPVKTRKKIIVDLIKRYPIENQDMLVELLKNEYNIETNQSVVSRDLRELGVTKYRFKDTMIYELKEVDVAKEILRLGVVSIVHNESTIIVNTLAGLAPYIGDFLDQHIDKGILGTLAGENAVFVAPQSTKNIKTVFETICQLVHYKKIH